MPLPPGVRGVLVDVEGTTTALSFVYDVLFPFAAARLEAVCALQKENVEVAAAVARLAAEHAAEEGKEEKGVPPFGDGAPYARYLMEQDRKSTGLKALQGLIWEAGYRAGELSAHVFPDVPEALRRWREAGVRLRVFSSGSVLAQRLLFGHTSFGDLTSSFEDYHDTTTGPKQDPASYRAIADSFELPPTDVLFLSDVTAELDAARTAGMGTGLLCRPGNRPAEAGGHPVYESFAELA
jgi:enolase-phosphatase E1